MKGERLIMNNLFLESQIVFSLEVSRIKQENSKSGKCGLCFGITDILLDVPHCKYVFLSTKDYVPTIASGKSCSFSLLPFSNFV